MPSIKLTALLTLLALSGEADAKLTKRKLEFIRTMRESEKVHGPIRMSRPNLAEFLKKSHEVSALKGGNSRKEDLERRLDYYAKYEQFARDVIHNRRLDEDPAYEGGQYNSNYNGYNANDSSTQNNHWYSNWFSNSNNGQQDNANQMYNDDANGDADQGNRYYDLLGLADLSLKYAGCSSTTSFSSDVEGDDSSHFVSGAYVQYRLCPAESCNDDSWQGCRSEYGEYMMTLEDFLDIQSELRNKEVEMLCGYCNSCYNFNESAYCNGNCCGHSHDCEDYDDVCSDEGDDDDEPPEYEQLFDCMEVDLSNNANGRKLEDGNGSNTAYVGVHCNGIHIELGLFSDNTCTQLIATDEQVDIEALTGFDFDSEDLENYYVPQGCLECGGEDYNWKTNWWYIDNDKDEESDDDYVNEVCYSMYQSSAKCNQNLSEDILENLEESDEEYAYEEATCAYIKDAVQGHIDANGFVYSTAGNGNGFWNLVARASDDPQYVRQGKESNGAVTAGQATALTFGALGTAGMGAAAYMMKQEVDKMGGAEGLMAQDDKQID